MSLAAIILAGGRATRLGGAPKPLLRIGGATLLQTAVDAAHAAGCRPIMVVGPEASDDPRLTWVREDPPFGGPAAAIVTALPYIEAEDVMLLAADLPRASEAVISLLESVAVAASVDGLCLADESGRPQWLAGVYRTSALRRAASRLRASSQPESGAGASMRELLADLEIATVRAPAGSTDDIDTWEDLEAARRFADSSRPPGGSMPDSPRTLPPEALDEWADALRERFGLGPDDLPVSLILDLARDVAGGVARPAAPFSAFAAGLVAGRKGGSPADVEEAVAAITELASRWVDRPRGD